MSLISVKNNKERFEIKLFKIRFSHKKKHKDINLINRKITIIIKIKTFLYKFFIQPFVLKRNEKKPVRYLEIGPGETRIKDFETLNTLLINETDYVGQLGLKLPFKDNSFDIVYLSHVLEHIFWHKLNETIAELYRIIKPNGYIEIWVPDGLKIAKAFVEAENSINNDYQQDGWYRFNPDKDPCLWYCGRQFAYGDGLTPYANKHYNVHLSSYSFRFLEKLLADKGFKNIEKMDNSQCRGYDHGWINLGIKAQK